MTDADLFFERPVKLPFLNVELPLKDFFRLGPALFLVVHAYVLLHFVGLAGKIRVFDTELRGQIAGPDMLARLRWQLPSNIFVQLLAGPEEMRGGITGWLLTGIAWISLVIGPVALLVFFQLQFLPYHNAGITGWQRLAIVIDLALLWRLWPRIVHREAAGRAWRAAGWATAILFGSVSLLMVFAIATFPGEWLDATLRGLPPIPAVRKVLVAGEIDFAARKPKSLWSNVLVLPGLDVIEHAKLDSEAKIAGVRETASLRARDLAGAVLIDAVLRKVDFTAANLRRVRLDRADLREAKFECPKDVSGDLLPDQCAQLQGASLVAAKLQGAALDRAQLQGAALREAQLQGANLNGAQLQGADLYHAQLQGASLFKAKLQGASLFGALLQGARLGGAQLQGAWLFGAQLQGADLPGAQLQAAELVGAALHGTPLFGAQLQGAELTSAELQGALLSLVKLQGALLVNVYVWRADVRGADARGAWIDKPETGPKEFCQNGGVCDWTAASLDDLKKRILEAIPPGYLRDKALARLDPVLDPAKPLAGEAEMARRWAELQSASASESDFEKERARQLQRIGCAADGAPYVLAGLIRGLEFRERPPLPSPPRGMRFQPRPYASQLAAEFLKSDCAGARGLSAADRAKLEEFVEAARP